MIGLDDMDYRAHYEKLVARGKRTLIHGYRERHHIVPKCMGGDNSEDNLVYLTAEEHFVAHQLLVKMYPNNRKLAFSLNILCGNGKNLVRNNKMFGWIRNRVNEAKKGPTSRRHSAEQKEKWSLERKGKPNPYAYKSCEAMAEANRGVKHSPERCAINSRAQTGKKLSVETLAKRAATIQSKKDNGTWWRQNNG